MAWKPKPGEWSPRVEHPDQKELVECIAEAIERDRLREVELAAQAAAEAARHEVGGNCAPMLLPTMKNLERIGRAQYGDLWSGKLASDTGLCTRRMRRLMEAGHEPPPGFFEACVTGALKKARNILRACGEEDAVYEVEFALQRRSDITDAAAARGREKSAKRFAKAAAAEIAAEEKARAALWAKNTAETLANPGILVSLARPLRPPRPARATA